MANSAPEYLTALAVAAAIGLALGLERETAHKPAGLRTQLLVTLGTAIFVLAGRSLGEEAGGRVAANVLTGLGFLGGGVILHQRGAVRGLTTAALIWVNGALGAAAGLGLFALAGAGAVSALIAMRALGAVERHFATRCRQVEYLVVAREGGAALAAIREALALCHRQDVPLELERRAGQVEVRVAFCSTPSRHEALVQQLRELPDVTRVEADELDAAIPRGR
jgi:putative Mg2+ transporter-C (MgtC) family protein